MRVRVGQPLALHGEPARRHSRTLGFLLTSTSILSTWPSFLEPSSSQAQTSGHEARTAQRVAHDSSLTPGTWLLQGDSARCSRLSMRTACSAVARAACICACLCAAGSFFSPFVSRCRIAFALLTICGAPGQGTRTHRHLLGQLSPESRPLHAVSHRSDFMSTAVLTQCRRPSRCSPTADGCSGAGAPSVTQSTASICSSDAFYGLVCGADGRASESHPCEREQ